jgi:hypothetical protein
MDFALTFGMAIVHSCMWLYYSDEVNVVDSSPPQILTFFALSLNISYYHLESNGLPKNPE